MIKKSWRRNTNTKYIIHHSTGGETMCVKAQPGRGKLLPIFVHISNEDSLHHDGSGDSRWRRVFILKLFEVTT